MRVSRNTAFTVERIKQMTAELLLVLRCNLMVAIVNFLVPVPQAGPFDAINSFNMQVVVSLTPNCLIATLGLHTTSAGRFEH